MLIREAVYQDRVRMALLHRNQIDRGFLRELGTPFLARLYGRMIKSPKCICRVAERDAAVVGFACACMDKSGFFREFALKEPGAILIATTRAAIRPSLIKGALELLGYGSANEETVDLPDTELFSISTAPEYRRAGVGGALIKNICASLPARGSERMKVSVGAELEEANSFYRHMGFVFQGRVQVHAGKTTNLYVVDTKTLAPAEVGETGGPA